jgi:hypothetical protein
MIQIIIFHVCLQKNETNNFSCTTAKFFEIHHKFSYSIGKNETHHKFSCTTAKKEEAYHKFSCPIAKKI